ncbi:hypothetical protein GOBAR_DD28880 [Gossypium barbadense]|nr:hypothetical protein GOBAR_DD28880 [Gossypium barbadense]
MECPLFDFKDFSEIDDFDFMDNDNDIMVNEAAINFSKGIEDIGSASGSNNNQPIIDEPNSNQILPAPANELHESPSTPQPSQMPKTLVDTGVELPPPLVTTNEQTQLDPMNANLNTFGEVPLDQLIASPDLPNESFLHGWSSDSNLKQPVSLGFEGNNPSLQNDDDACQTTSPPFSPLIMERTNSFPLPLEEMLLKDGVYTTQPVYSECRANSIETNQFNRHIGSSLPEDRVYTTQPVYLERRVNLVKANNLNGHIGSSLPEDGVYTAKPVDLECRVNSLQKNTLNGHVGSSLQDKLLSCSPQREDLMNPSRRTGVGLLHGRSTQVNRQAPAWNSYKANDFYRPLASSGSQANEFQSIGNSDSQHYNFIQPRPSTLLRSQHQLKNSSQLLNQVPNRPNASDSLLQHSMFTKHSMPSQLMSQNLSYQQHDQVSMAPGAYNPRTYSTRLTESSMPLRTSTLAPNRQTNPLDVSDLRYRNSLQPRSSMLFNSRSYQMPRHQQASNQFSIHALSKLPHHQQASSQFSMPCLSNPDLYNSKLPESSILQKNDCHDHQETGDTSTSQQVGTPLSNYKKQRASRRQRPTLARTRYGLGESSSSFKRFRVY